MLRLVHKSMSALCISLILFIAGACVSVVLSHGANSPYRNMLFVSTFMCAILVSVMGLSFSIRALSIASVATVPLAVLTYLQAFVPRQYHKRRLGTLLDYGICIIPGILAYVGIILMWQAVGM